MSLQNDVITRTETFLKVLVEGSADLIRKRYSPRNVDFAAVLYRSEGPVCSPEM